VLSWGKVEGVTYSKERGEISWHIWEADGSSSWLKKNAEGVENLTLKKYKPEHETTCAPEFGFCPINK
jgi:hypothetical protein